MEGLELINIHKSFGGTPALKGVSFHVGQGEVVAVVGPSGSGKSTLLSVIAGLLPADEGEVWWDGESIAGVPPHRRGFGLMFQDFALFPHRNVFQNIAFPLQMAHLPKERIQIRVDEMLGLVGLPGFGERDVNTLSGGEQQRIALARSLAPHPRLLMLDEPLGSLDRNLRERLVFELREILHKMGQTAVYVTHDQEEAFTLSDRVVVMNAGEVEQIAAPQEIYLHPASEFVARFIGLNNLLPGKVTGERDQRFLETPIGRFPLERSAPPQVTVLIRPDLVHLDREGAFTLRGAVEEKAFRGATCRVVVSVNGELLRFDLPSYTELPEVGQPVQLSFNREALQVFPS